MLSLSTGMRQSLGVFMPEITQNIGVALQPRQEQRGLHSANLA